MQKLCVLSFILMPHIHLIILILACLSVNSFSFFIGHVSLPCNIHNTPCMLHGSETWPMKKENELTLKQAEMRVIRWMCGIKIKDSGIVA